MNGGRGGGGGAGDSTGSGSGAVSRKLNATAHRQPVQPCALWILHELIILNAMRFCLIFIDPAYILQLHIKLKMKFQMIFANVLWVFSKLSFNIIQNLSRLDHFRPRAYSHLYSFIGRSPFFQESNTRKGTVSRDKLKWIFKMLLWQFSVLLRWKRISLRHHIKNPLNTIVFRGFFKFLAW